MKENGRYHAGHMEHTISEKHEMGMEGRNIPVKERDVPRVNPRMNPGAAGGSDSSNAALKIAPQGPPKPGRSNAEGDAD